MLLDDPTEKSSAAAAFGADIVSVYSDEELISRSFDNPHFFSVLVDRYEEVFLRKAFYILGNKEAAEDAVQDTFVKVYRNARRFTPQPGAGFKSWAYRILVNTCFTAYKKHKNEKAFLADLDPEIQELISDKRVAEGATHMLNRDEVLSLLNRLPESLSAVMRLHFIEGKPHAEVAKIVGISEGAVRARVHRAKKELHGIKKKLDEKMKNNLRAFR